MEYFYAVFDDFEGILNRERILRNNRMKESYKINSKPAASTLCQYGSNVLNREPYIPIFGITGVDHFHFSGILRIRTR